MEQQSLPRWTDWARELQALAQAGLEYSKDPFDRERFQRIRDISAEMVAEGAQLPLERVKTLFCGESGYQTPRSATACGPSTAAGWTRTSPSPPTP